MTGRKFEFQCILSAISALDNLFCSSQSSAAQTETEVEKFSLVRGRQEVSALVFCLRCNQMTKNKGYKNTLHSEIDTSFGHLIHQQAVENCGVTF